jgi:hypothetical protein
MSAVDNHMAGSMPALWFGSDFSPTYDVPLTE